MIDNNELHADENSSGDLRAPCEQAAPETVSNGAAVDAPPLHPGNPSGGRVVTGYDKNHNAMRHGLRASKLPKGCGFIHREVRAFRRALEDAVVATHGDVSIVHAAAINTALRAETHAQLCARWLRNEVATLDHNQRLAYSAAIVKASEARDKALDRLGIDRNVADSFDRQYTAALAAAFTAPAAPEDSAPDPQQEAQQ